MAELSQSFSGAKKQLMKKHGLSEKDAEKAIIVGYARIAKLAGEPVDEKKVTLMMIQESIDSGKYEQMERKAKSAMQQQPQTVPQNARPTGGVFEMRRTKNKFI
jgi:hypothetical protein